MDNNNEILTGAEVESPSRPRVAFVDDDPKLRILGNLLLTQIGAEVTKFGDGMSAQSAIEKNPDSIDIILSDNTMPGMSGKELLGYIAESHPNIYRVLATGDGFSTEEIQELIEKGTIHAYLSKPYAAKEVITVLEEFNEWRARNRIDHD